MASAMSSASRALVSGVLGFFPTTDLEAELSSVSPFASRSASLSRQNNWKILDTQIKSYNYKFQGTYVGALLKASVLMPNFRVGLVMTACLPVSSALSTLELLAGRVVPVAFDGSTMVEGTVCPTTASSPDAKVRSTLAAGLEKAKTQIKPANRRWKYSIATN
jgi:hypothetical protein